MIGPEENGWVEYLTWAAIIAAGLSLWWLFFDYGPFVHNG